MALCGDSDIALFFQLTNTHEELYTDMLKTHMGYAEAQEAKVLP